MCKFQRGIKPACRIYLLVGLLLLEEMYKVCVLLIGLVFEKLQSKNIYFRFSNKVKVKVTLEQATKAQRGSIGVALIFL
jgi:hypothetical protein